MMMMGKFSFFLSFTILLIIHELGHALIAYHYHWNIDSITIYPFGGMTRFLERINRPLKEEFMIVLAGPVFQHLFFCVVSYFITDELFLFVHYFLLGFNLLPMIPLDGGKLLELSLERFFSFHQSRVWVLKISFVFLIVFAPFSFYSQNLIGILLTCYLGKEWYRYYSLKDHTTYKFLLERFLYPIHFQKRMVIEGANIKKMKRDYSHLFYSEKKYWTEREMLRKMFDFSHFL